MTVKRIIVRTWPTTRSVPACCFRSTAAKSTSTRVLQTRSRSPCAPGVPIFATDSVLDRAGVVPEGAEEEKLSVFRDFVNSLNVDLPDEPPPRVADPTDRG